MSDELGELALGILTGEDRAGVLAHLEGCERCSTELGELTAVADRLTMDGPEADPPAGFELRVLERIQEQPRRPWLSSRRRTQAVMAVAAAALALLAAFAVGRATERRRSPSPTRSAAPALGSGLRVAELTAAGKARGEVYAYSGRSPWLLVTVSDLPAGSSVTCEVTTASGTELRLGTFWLPSGHGSWATGLPVAPGALRSAQVTAASGAVLARATFTA